MDIGAYESSFSRVQLSEVHLADMILSGYAFSPSFHRDSLKYTVVCLDTITVLPELIVVPEDPMAKVEIDIAEDIFSPDADKRTATIKVTSSDGTNEKIYRVEFNILSTVKTLSSLEVEGYSLVPSFAPEYHSYAVYLPDTVTKAPLIKAAATHDKAEIEIDIESTNLPDRLIATIIVTSEAGRPFHQPYFISMPISVTDWESDNLVKVFPNPVIKVLTVQLNKPSRTEIKITTLNGQQLNASEMEGTSFDIDLSSFQKGVYLITISSKEFVTTRKIIKL